MISKLHLMRIRDIFRLGDPRFGFYVTLLIVFASACEVLFLYLVGGFINGDDICLPLTEFCVSSSNTIQFLIAAFIFRSFISLYSNSQLYRYSIGYVGLLSTALANKITQITAKSYSSYDSTHTIYTEANQVVNNIIHPTLLIFRDLMFVAAITAYVIYEYQAIAVVFFLYVLTGSICIVIILIPRLKAMGLDRQLLDQKRLKRTEDLSQLRHELFLTVKNKSLVSRELNKVNMSFSKVVAKYMFLRASNRTFLEIILFFAIIATMATVSMDGTSATEFYAVLAVAALRALPAITNIISFANGFSFHIPALDQVAGLLMGGKSCANVNEESLFDFSKMKSLEICFSKSVEIEPHKHSFASGVLNVVVGESGVGKSTLLKSITGESDLFSVSCSVNGQDLSESELQSEIAYCPQDIHVVDTSFKDNALLFCAEGEELGDVAMARMKELGIGGVLINRDNINSATISGGQKRKLAFLRCLMLDRQVLICDEPTSELDNNSAASIITILLELSKKKLVIVTSHDPRLISAVHNSNILEL